MTPTRVVIREKTHHSIRARDRVLSPTMAPAFIQKILEVGGRIELLKQYSPDFITQWVRIAAERGGHILVSGGYHPDMVIGWAKLGGNSFTYRVQ